VFVTGCRLEEWEGGVVFFQTGKLDTVTLDSCCAYSPLVPLHGRVVRVCTRYAVGYLDGAGGGQGLQ
jgi:hypothetical protein